MELCNTLGEDKSEEDSTNKSIDMAELCRTLLADSEIDFEAEGKLRRISRNIATMSRIKFS